MFGKGGLGNLMKQAQQMQEKMQKMQEEIAQLEVTGESGAGLVKVTINGAHTWWLQHSTTQHVVSKKRRKKKWLLYPPECSCRLALRCRSDANQPAVNTAYGSTALSAGRWPEVGAAYGVHAASARS